MDYENKYKDALELARDYHKANLMLYKADENAVLEDIFPELAESEDEKTRKELTEFLEKASGGFLNTTIKCKTFGKWLSWLEKQGKQETICDKCKKEHPSHFCQDITALGRCALEHEQKSSDNKVEPKFNIGDWITDGYLHCKISDVLDDRYIVDTKFAKRSAIPFKRENEYHLWAIEDAKDGDILASNYNRPFIYNGNHNSRHVGAHCGITTNDKLIIASEECHWTENLNIHPANKDQRDILMNAMNDDGYVFDFDKKELKKKIYLSAKHNSQPIKPTDE